MPGGTVLRVIIPDEEVVVVRRLSELTHPWLKLCVDGADAVGLDEQNTWGVRGHVQPSQNIHLGSFDVNRHEVDMLEWALRDHL